MTLIEGDWRPARGVEATVSVLDRVIEGRIAWRRADIRLDEWLVPVSPAALAELETIAEGLADYRGTIEDLKPDPFDWPATTEMLVDVKSRIEHGVGFAVLDRLPVERWSETASRGVAWLLNSRLAPPIMQKWKGHRVYDVKDTGARLAHGVRRSTTNLAQELHTDGSFLGMTPELMGLSCLRQAATGGNSRVVSLATVHNDLRDRQPEHLARLYRPFWWDRQKEHAPDEIPSSRLPIYWTDGRRLGARYYDDYIRNGQSLVQAALDEKGDAALAAMREVVEDPDNWIEFRLEPGQFEFVDNHLLAHSRTWFRDPEGTTNGRGGRLLLRFWLRNAGGIGLEAETPVSA